MRVLLWVGLAAVVVIFGVMVMEGTDSDSVVTDAVLMQENVGAETVTSEGEGGLEVTEHPYQISYMRDQEYPGSELVIEQTLAPGSNYARYVVSYKSEGLKQFALLTVPNGELPEGGFPAIVFNHGYISPEVYRTTERYVAYTDGFSRRGYVVLKPDYRGHGNSEGEARGGYGSTDYTIDVLNAFSSLQQYPGVNPERIGMWGHSMGGWITQNAMVINPDVKAGVIWGGVVGTYEDLFTEWWGKRRRPTPTASPAPGQRGYWRRQMFEEYGTHEVNPAFWNSISSAAYLDEISGPIQLHHAKGDETVPFELSVLFDEEMKAAGQTSELYLYEGDDHNISGNFSAAMRESVAWFDAHL